MKSEHNGRFVWHELLTSDPQAAISFYSSVVGWTTQPFNSDYTMWVGSQGPLGGVMQLPDEAKKMGAPPHWMGSVQVDGIDGAVAKVRKLGGRIYVEPKEIPTVGRIAVIGDIDGAPLGLIEPITPMAPHSSDKPGEFAWNELYANNQEASLNFYSELFGWKKTNSFDMGPIGAYVIFGIGGKDLGGMMNKPKEMPAPPMWAYYAELADLNAALHQAKAKGAQVVNAPQDVPGGRMAQLIDPQGAFFAMHQLAR